VNSPLLLDTCAAIWILENAPMSDAAVAAVDEAFDGRRVLYVSPITAWEIGLLMARGRCKSALSPQQWFKRLLAVPGVRPAEMSHEVLILSSYLPPGLSGDPADRILAATARENDFTLMTRDARLLAYGAEGHLRTVRC
jgi:PIN domain nuclease of toxin-antitoxin system